MKSYTPPPVPEHLVVEIRNLASAGATQAQLIQTMRDRGLSQIPSIRLIRGLCGLSLGEAKEAVHFSPTWSDRREDTEALHDALFAAADELGFGEESAEMVDAPGTRVL